MGSLTRRRRFGFGVIFGLEGLSRDTQRGLSVAFATSIALVMGMQIVYPVLPVLMDRLAVDPSGIGLVVTAYTLPAVLLAPIAGTWADLYGRRPMLIGGLLLFGAAGAAVGLAPSFEWVLALRALQGVGMSALTPLTIVLLSDLVDDQQESAAQGAKVVLDRLAISAAPVVAGILALISWNLPFFLFALTVPLALLAWRWLPETQPSKPESLRVYVGGFAGIGRRPRLLVAFGAGFLRFFLDYAYFTYLPIYLALAQGATPDAIGLIFACFAVGAIVTASQVGRLTRRWELTRLVVLGFVLAGVAILAVPVLPNGALVGVSMLVYGLGNGLISPLQKRLLTSNAPPEQRAGVVSLDRVLQQVAKSLAPGAVGLILVVADLGVAFILLGGFSLASVALAVLLLTTWGERREPVLRADLR